MKVVPIRSKGFIGEYSSTGKETVPEEVKFLVGVALTLLVPSLFYSAVSGQLLMLYLVASSEALGTVMGIVMFQRSSNGLLSCIPVDRIPNVARGTSAAGRRKAA